MLPAGVGAIANLGTACPDRHAGGDGHLPDGATGVPDRRQSRRELATKMAAKLIPFDAYAYTQVEEGVLKSIASTAAVGNARWWHPAHPRDAHVGLGVPS